MEGESRPDPALLLRSVDHESGDDHEPAGDVLDEEELVAPVPERTRCCDDHAEYWEKTKESQRTKGSGRASDEITSSLDEQSESCPSPSDVSSTSAWIRAWNVDVNPSSNVNRAGDDHEASAPAMEDV